MLQLTVTLPLTDEERAILASLVGVSEGNVSVTEPAAAPARRTRAKAAEPVAEEPAAEDDLMGTAEPAAPAPTLDDVVARATEVMKGGDRDKVKAALAAHGASKVSELKPSTFAAFLTALEG